MAAIFAAQMFELTCSTFWTSSTPCGWVSLMTCLPIFIAPFSQSKVDRSLTSFSSSAAATTNALNVEPGSKASVAARLRSAPFWACAGEFGLKRG